MTGPVVTEPRRDLSGALVRAAALGALASAVQLVFVYRKVHVNGTFAWASRDMYWTSPVANILLLVALVALLWTVGLVVPRLRSPGVIDAVVGTVAALAALLVIGGLAEWAVMLLALGAGVQWSRLPTGRAHVLQRWVTRVGLAVGLLTIVGGMGERLTRARRAGGAEVPAGSGPNVLLIIWDTVRAANLGLYGYTRPTSPELEQLARDGVTWNWAMSPAPWTLPSHCSMFTGLHPGEHSCRWDDPLRGDPVTLAGEFRRHGWRTAGFVANPFYTTAETGLQRGFDVWEDFRLSPRQVLLSSTLMQTAVARDVLTGEGWEGKTRALRQLKLRGDPKPLSDRKLATHVVDEFLDWQAREQRPFFATLNLFDAHDPYDPPAPWRTKFVASPDRVALYDGGIAYMDHELGRLLRELERRGALANTVVVVTSDHGEMFGEHGIDNHGHALYLPLIHVPLVIRAPGRLAAGTRSESTVGLRDLGATLLDLAGISEPGRFPGQSLVPTVGASIDTTPAARLVLAETERSKLFWGKGPARDGAMHALMDDRYHYIRDGKGREELFRYRVDTGQMENLAGLDTSRAAWYRSRLGTVSRRLVR